jgi:hypothetical protein
LGLLLRWRFGEGYFFFYFNASLVFLHYGALLLGGFMVNFTADTTLMSFGRLELSFLAAQYWECSRLSIYFIVDIPFLILHLDGVI